MSELEVGFDDLTVLSEGGADVFVLNLNGADAPPPYYLSVAGRRFAFTGETFLIQGHSAGLAGWVREQDERGALPLLAERGDRYLRYVHEPPADGGDGTGGEGGEA